ncbi:hypothetical protein GCM10019059_34830 [Camelimonas fluminis]|uniref:DUF935 domain-containing protein n=1 Tax=Camelimonas fluminis TaxID=1576911 RepID=A0ABV7UFT0_9HYPH|nr:DUF935 domain-containing protein [Camelimonas fluminis]GHE72248.1 hypothetical protein GCM10019059_34830 [Camelimonas fluminis]
MADETFSPILGPDGRRIRKQALTRTEADPAITGIPHTFDESIASGLTPGALARTLRAAADGDMHDFLTLAEEMEEREPHYRYVLETRKNGVTSLDVRVDPASDDGRDVEIADFVREEIVETPQFQTLADMLADGLAKGFSAVEIEWDIGARWLPVAYEWRDPRLFQFDRATRKELRLRARGEPDGRPLTWLKWLVHVPLLKMGIPARNGLARVAVWAFMFKSFSLRDWAQFLEVYGHPLRVGKFGPGASEEDKRVLLRAVRQLGRDAGAMIPEAMTIDLLEAKGFSDKPFEGHAKFFDEQMSKLIIGKPGDGVASSRAGEEVLDKVRIDIKRSDARDMMLTLAQQLIRPVIDINFGPQKKYPKVHLPVPDRKDLAVWSDAVAKMVDRGLEVEQSQVFDAFGLKEPAKGAKLLTVTTSQGANAPRPPPQTPAERASALPAQPWRLDPRVCQTCGPARLAADGGGDEDEVDRLVQQFASQWQDDMEPVLAAIRSASEQASSYEEFLSALDGLAADLPVDRLAYHLGATQLIGRIRGEAGQD